MVVILCMLISVMSPPATRVVRDVYSPDSNDSGIDTDHSLMTSRRYRHVTNPELPETADATRDNEGQSPQQQVGIAINYA